MDKEAIRRAEGERSIAWLNKHWKGRRSCPICNNNNWDVGYVNEMRTFNGGNLVLGGTDGGLFPVVPVSCDQCGYVVLFSAVKAGVVNMEEWRSVNEGDQL